MRIKQAHISSSVQTFKKRYLEKFGLVDYHDPTSPVVIFGLYGLLDYRFFIDHKAPIVVVWCGSDSIMLNDKRAGILKLKPAVHIVKSKFMSDDLKRYGIHHKILPVSWQTNSYDPCPRGKNIYHYGNGKNNFYGEAYLPEIKRRTGLNIITTTAQTYGKAELMRIYQSCFIGLRLTHHDGLPNTVLELGMMGRRSIYNGGIPGSIPWKTPDDIVNSILQEYCYREKDDTREVGEKIKEFINIGDKWLNV